MAGVSERSGRFRKLKKPVDDVAEVLHNLVSPLLMQRRRTKRCRVVVRLTTRGGGLVVNAHSIFKN